MCREVAYALDCRELVQRVHTRAYDVGQIQAVQINKKFSMLEGQFQWMDTMSLSSLIAEIPKAELHVHIEGTLEPELMMALAERNKITMPYANVDEIRRAYYFTDLQSFLDVYHVGTQVLRTEQDFYDMTWAYLQQAAADNVRHTELFIDTQTHTDRGIPFETVINGIGTALKNAETGLGVSGLMILCFLRHLSAAAAMETFETALPHLDSIQAFGLASSESGNPPSKFKDVFDRINAEGIKAVAHAGEEGPPEYIWEALDLLNVARIDHGVRCVEDHKLVARLIEENIPLTVCPLSNVKLKVFDRLEDHNLKAMLDVGLCVTVNSDDPSYFGGYIGDNYIQCQQALGLNSADIHKLAANAIEASFIDASQKNKYKRELNQVFTNYTA